MGMILKEISNNKFQKTDKHHKTNSKFETTRLALEY